MKPVEALPLRGWQASLDLDFECRDGRSVLARRAGFGPLAIQKALYPEGEKVCHAILLHPPAGIAGGDELSIGISVGAGAHALLTTPGAAKWYRSAGAQAVQQVRLTVARDAVCEWLPQENIFFAAAQARNELTVTLEAGAAFCGWDLMCLGRTAGGEKFSSGRVIQRLRMTRDGHPLLEEAAHIEGGGGLLDSPVGLAGFPVCATFFASGFDGRGQLLEALRNVASPIGGRWGITELPQCIVGRFLGESAEVARAYCVRLWQAARPYYAKREACAPRIWST